MGVKLCGTHRMGVSVDTPPFYVAGCPACESKRAMGIVRGDEGPPAMNWKRRRKVHIDWPRLAREKAARERAQASQMKPRGMR